MSSSPRMNGSVPVLLRAWADEGRSHGGVIMLTDADTRRPSIGRVARAIARVIEDLGDTDWTNRYVHLKR